MEESDFDKGKAEGIKEERERCAEIVQMARAGIIDHDWRSITAIIKRGESIETIKTGNY